MTKIELLATSKELFMHLPKIGMLIFIESEFVVLDIYV